MKSFAFVIAFALLALAVPASAAEISNVATTTTLLQQIEGRPAPLELFRQPIPYCSAVQGTSCTTLGATMGCTDVCNDQLSCTCTSLYSNPSARIWNCSVEC
jgi:hypothetical protein